MEKHGKYRFDEYDHLGNTINNNNAESDNRPLSIGSKCFERSTDIQNQYQIANDRYCNQSVLK